jgi:lactoylglutathione lyase
MAFSVRDAQINYYVVDVETATRFYTEHFGFAETFRTPKQGKPEHVEVRLGPLTLGLASREAAQSVHGLPVGPAGGSLRVELVLWTDDIDGIYAQLVAEGVRSLKPPHNFEESLRSASLVDPDGNPVQIVMRWDTHLGPAENE